MPSISFISPHTRPYLSLTSIFLFTRFIYFTIALLTPSPAYDSSTDLILPPPEANGSGGVLWQLLARLSEKLTRWDAIYFVKIAERGYVYEQEWAFGWGFTTLVGFVGRVLAQSIAAKVPDPYVYIFAGLLIANTSHLVSVFVLYKLSKHVFPSPTSSHAFLAATLHILSPAGLFLAAPYSESLFSLLTFTGYLIYAKSTACRNSTLGDLGVSITGVVFALATTVRSNGILNGLILLYDFIKQVGLLFGLVSSQESGPTIEDRISRIFALGAAGMTVGAGFILPQAIAWKEYCTDQEGLVKREWCTRKIPSIYLWVQGRYWNVGFLRYWTLSNIPLFLLAAPMLYILIKSGYSAITTPSTSSPRNPTKHTDSPPNPVPRFLSSSSHPDLIKLFSLPQLALSILAVTSYHVQIITRLSSGYVVWYWWVAEQIISEAGDERKEADGDGAGKKRRRKKVGLLIVRWIVVYAFVQAVLFAGFLPPA